MRKTVETINRNQNWRHINRLADGVIDTAIQIQQIAAPTFAEQARAQYVATLMREINLQHIEIDSLFNVYGLLPSANPDAPGLMVSAHLDTVFDAEVDLSIRRVRDLIYGPGLGDNSTAVAGIIGLARWFKQEEITPEHNIWFVATTREEGLGDLGGMKAAFERLCNRVYAVINVEGLAYGHVYHAGIAVRRLHITATASGGHSWLHYGRASALHGIIELGAKITAIRPPQSPRTTYNIGMVNGGQSINSIATRAEMWLDMRSEVRENLQQLEDKVLRAVKSLETEDLRFKVNVVGDRPSGYLSVDHPLVQGSLAALKQVGVKGHLQTGSTDANIPLSDGTPAVTIGITQGGNAHRLDEYIETKPVASGLKQLIMLTLAASKELFVTK